MPAISQRLLARERLLKQRARAERARLARQEPHEVHYFHQVDDPYSALTAACLPQLLERYDITIKPHVVGPPPDNAAPERDKLAAYSRKDAQLLASHYRLGGFAFHDTGAQPVARDVAMATRLLVTALQNGDFVQAAGQLSSSLWQDPVALAGAALQQATVTHAEATTHLTASNALRQKLGHYLGATFFYGGEWYWGIDRLHHLERRLQALGIERSGSADLMFAPGTDLQDPVRVASPARIDFFVSLRSPYSAIAAPRVFALGRRTGAQVRLRFVLPMVMRGLPVPREKRRYISQDAAREAFVRGIPFGRLNDPVGRPTERGLALMPLAERAGKSESYLLSFMHGVWAQGLDAGSDRGLRQIVERSGLHWGQARLALQDQGWRETAEQNREALFSLGLWGVPSFSVGDTAVWGQDRLWAVEDELRKGMQSCSLF